MGEVNSDPGEGGFWIQGGRCGGFVPRHISSPTRELGTSPSCGSTFCPEGDPLRNSNFRRRIWSKGLQEAGLVQGLRIRDLRHTCASLLIAEGAHPRAVMGHLGHSSITVTMDRYGHLFPSDMEALAEALGAARSRALAAQPRPKGCRALKRPSENPVNMGVFVVGPEGIEPSTLGLKVPCSAN